MQTPEGKNENFLAQLTKEQRLQVQIQLEEHEHERYTVDIELGDVTLKDFVVYPDVLRPERMVACDLAIFLHQHPAMFRNKTSLDMGSGAGLQGIVTGLDGASRLIFSDISEQAIANTRENVEKFGLTKKSFIIQSDLFSNITESSDRIIFNHPFFPGKPTERLPVSRAMLDEGGLLQRFLQESRAFLKDNGSIIMPYLQMAGETNDPSVQAPKHGYEVTILEKKNVSAGTQKGLFSIIELKQRK